MTKSDDFGAWAERAWFKMMRARGYSVLPCSQLLGNHRGTVAPMLHDEAGDLPLPDGLVFFSKPGSQGQIWTEVKAKTEPGFMRCRGRWEHGIDYKNWLEYVRIADITGKPLVVVVYEANSPKQGAARVLEPSGKWLYAELKLVQRVGVRMTRWPNGRGGRGGMGGFLWPRHVMDEIKPQTEMFTL